MPPKTKKTSRKRREEDDVPTVNTTESLREKLRQKLREKQLGRTSFSVRENRLEKLEDKLEETNNHTDRQRIKDEISLLEKVRENEMNTVAGEYPDYGDNAGYGGAMERPD
jgi:hypothetical protein